MGLIIKNKIKMLKKGYPTVSDKYDVQGGLLGGSTAVKFGELVKFGSQPGLYEAIAAAIDSVDKIAGVVVATNVKLATTYPAGDMEVSYAVGEAINLLPFKQNAKGFLAIEVDSGCNVANIAEGKKVAVLLASGKFTTSGASNATDLPGAYFTGIKERIGGTDEAPIYLAEVAFNA